MKSLGLVFEDGHLSILDQTRLPLEEIWISINSTTEMVEAIRTLKVRGAPLIGVAAALSLATAAHDGASMHEISVAAKALGQSRPTAVNLHAALDRMLAVCRPNFRPELLLQKAQEIFEEDVRLCDSMGERGAELICDGDHILTHCNAGGLATVGIGTAIGVIRRAHEQKKTIHVFVDETRPLLQGARLTAWELRNLGISHTLICDNMAASIMQKGRIQKVFVGADRIASNGDFANKIGTYGLAVLAHHHGIPFYPVAPRTTIDFNCPSGNQIPIEQRDPAEVRGQSSLRDTQVFNPAFDVTPVDLVTALVLDSGIYTKNELKSGALKRLQDEPQ